MPTVLRNHYVLAVPNVAATAEWFVADLGFAPVPVGDKGWRFVKKNECMVMLGECPDAIHPSQLGDHSYFAYLVVDNADAYFEELKRRKADVMSEMADKPWGMREFGVRTPDGHRIMIGQEIQSREQS